jgi:8-oxo-dGTP pyrophosphatase MutT (NUDIX family)
MTPPPSSDTSTEADFSAGGVVVREGEVIVVVPVKRDADGNRVLGLPKGHPDGGETAEQAATREVREEAGVHGELVEKLGDVRYWHRRLGRRVSKRVTFYLFEYRSGNLEDHDGEIEEARWMPLEQAMNALTYAGEREMVARALSRMAADR